MAKNKHKVIPFSGKLMTAEPAVVGENFRTLKNVRYWDNHVKGVQGMTKINSAAVMDATYLKTRSAFHFVKTQPAESHVLAQAYNTGLTASQILDNKTAIPGTGSFEATEVWTDSSGAVHGSFSDAPDGQIIYCNGVDSCMWGGDEMAIGAFVTSTAAVVGSATSPKDHTEILNKTNGGAGNVASLEAGADDVWLVGTIRPIQGLKYYVWGTNETASTMTGTYWNGSSWAALANFVDNTDTGATLAQTGTVTFNSTVSTAKPKYLEGYFLYWYQFAMDAGAASLYHVTVDAPFQGIIDMWDGIYRSVARFYKYTSSYLDNTINVLEDDYDATMSYTYADLASLQAFSDPNNALEIGFTEKMTGLRLEIAPDYTNATAATTASVDYWTGTDYATVGTITDGTSDGSISLAKSGVVSWSNASVASETQRVVANSPPLYYYRLKFDKALDSTVRLSYVGGITAQKDLKYYKFPVFSQGRVLLCADMAGEKNKATCSGKYMPQVYNGVDSVDIYYGEQGELTCGTELFSQFGSNLYSLILMFKDTEFWITAGQDIDSWANNTFLLSDSIGCPAPLTLKTVNLAAEPGKGINRNLAIWQGANGIFMSDGRAPIPIHGDIKAYFDRSDSRCIRASKVGDSVGFIDPVKNEYHWLFASGTAATTLNTEMVYSIEGNKWFEIERSSDLQCGVLVRDTDGNNYNYGFLDTGYMERLENGTDFDGGDITHTIQHGDFPLSDLAHETNISRIRLLTVAKTTTTNSMTVTHYGDTSSTGTDITMSPAKTGYRIAKPDNSNEYVGDPFHSLKYVMTTDDETTGFEPLATVIAFTETRED